MWRMNVRRALRTSAREANMFGDQIMLSFPRSDIQNIKLLLSIKLCTSNKNGYTVDQPPIVEDPKSQVEVVYGNLDCNGSKFFLIRI